MLTLCITGFEADPEAVTAILGFNPTSVARKGQAAWSNRPHIGNGWWHEADDQRLVNGAQHDEALARLLANLQGREEQFAELRAKIQPKQVSIYGGLYVPVDGQCGVWLEPDQMRLLASCGVGWGLDFLLDD